MNITLLGAAGGEVTGSAYVLRTARANVMIDCGMFQGARKWENQNRIPKREALRDLDAVVLTHAHLDHTGRLPLLARLGYRGPIFATPATIDLTHLILRDAARLQSEDARRHSRAQVEQGKPPVKPLYSTRDVDALRLLFRKMKYDRPTEVAPGINVRAVEAGHVLGSASLEVTVEENGQRKVVVFSGDIGPRGAPLHRDPTPFKSADVVFMESTYGDHDHCSLRETAALAREAVAKTVAERGRILVPVFAIGRSQLLLLLLAGAFARRTLEQFPIFLDSPMAIEATEIYKRHSDLFDDDAASMMRSGELARNLRTAKVCPKPAQSRAIGRMQGPFMVMAGAGMCTGGRILQHMANHLSDPTTLLLMVGYQSRGSIGRAIVEGAKSVRIMGRSVPVRARTHTFSGLSGHAGQSDLLAWIGSIAPSRPRVYLTHGEDRQRSILRDLIRQRHGLVAETPDYLQSIEV